MSAIMVEYESHKLENVRLKESLSLARHDISRLKSEAREDRLQIKNLRAVIDKANTKSLEISESEKESRRIIRVLESDLDKATQIHTYCNHDFTNQEAELMSECLSMADGMAIMARQLMGDRPHRGLDISVCNYVKRRADR